MKVIGAGFGRTGTSTQQATLQELGFGPCYHMAEVMYQYPEHADSWVAAYSGGSVDWGRLFAGVESTVDFPGCFFWRELLSEFSDAKVILSVREPRSWYQSVMNTIFNPAIANESQNEELSDERRAAVRIREKIVPAIKEHVFDNRLDEEHAIGVFLRHNEEVQREVPADQLLVYDVSQGWAPLCTFLGVEVPHALFPRVNDTNSFLDNSKDLRSTGGQ
jgi:hypothetical protein